MGTFTERAKRHVLHTLRELAEPALMRKRLLQYMLGRANARLAAASGSVPNRWR